MKKIVSLLILLMTTTAFAQSYTYTDAVTSHLLRNRGDIDHSALLHYELGNILYNLEHDIIQSVDRHLPNILEGVVADFRMNADKRQKCRLQRSWSSDSKSRECR